MDCGTVAYQVFIISLFKRNETHVILLCVHPCKELLNPLVSLNQTGRVQLLMKLGACRVCGEETACGEV